MNRRFTAIMIVSLFCGIGGIFGVPGILYADDIQLPHITVFGTATTNVTPDTMVWSLTVRNTGSDLQKVAKQHNGIVSGVLKFIKKKKKVDKHDIQTAMMEFGENWEYKNSSRVKEGYYSSTSISFKLKKFDKYKDLWIGLSKKENVSVDGVFYAHSRRIDYQNQTRTKALLAAKQKAMTLAAALGSTVGEPIVIEEDLSLGSYSGGSTHSNTIKTVPAADETPAEGIAPGTIPVKIRVKVIFRLITH